MKNFKVLSVCGSGVATSTLVADKLNRYAEARDITLDIMECKMTEVKSKVDSFNPDVVIHTTDVNVDDCQGKPTFSAIPLLTGIGGEKLATDILDALEAK